MCCFPSYKELDIRTQLYAAGLRTEKRSVFNEYTAPGPSTSKKRVAMLENEKVCELCDRICYLSMVSSSLFKHSILSLGLNMCLTTHSFVYLLPQVLNEQDEQVLCLEHGLKHVQKKKNLKTTRLFLRYNQVSNFKNKKLLKFEIFNFLWKQ